MAAITQLDNSFKVISSALSSPDTCTLSSKTKQHQVRQFPDGAEAGLSKATAFMDSGEWEKNLEGLELIVSLARGHAEVKHTTKAQN